MSPWPALLNHILRCVGFYGSFTQTGRELKWPSLLPTHIKQRLVSWEENKHLCFCSFMKICAASRQPLQSRVGGLRSCLYLRYLLHWQGLDQNVHLSPGHKSDVNMLWQSFPRNEWLTLRRTVLSPGSISMVKGRNYFHKSSALRGNCSVLKYVCTTLSPTADLATLHEGAKDASSYSPPLFPRTVAWLHHRNQTGATVEATGRQHWLPFLLHSCGWEIKAVFLGSLAAGILAVNERYMSDWLER